MQENIRNLCGIRNSYLISHRLIARTQPILNVKSWTQNSSQMVDLLGKPSNDPFFCTYFSLTQFDVYKQGQKVCAPSWF